MLFIVRLHTLFLITEGKIRYFNLIGEKAFAVHHLLPLIKCKIYCFAIWLLSA